MRGGIIGMSSRLGLTIRAESHSVEHNVTQILEHLYLGGDDICDDRAMLLELNIGRIVNATSDSPNYFPDDFGYLHVDVPDEVDAVISNRFEEVSDFIAGAVGEKRSCLVHCSAGMSRSATLVLAYLVRHVGMSLLDALSHTKARRPLVSPNPGFMAQLVELERATRGAVSLDLRKYRRDRFGQPHTFALLGTGETPRGDDDDSMGSAVAMAHRALHGSTRGFGVDPQSQAKSGGGRRGGFGFDFDSKDAAAPASAKDDASMAKDEYEDIDCTPRDFTPRDFTPRDYTPRDVKDEDSTTGPSPGLGPPEGRMHRIQTMQSECGDGDMKDDDMETR